MKFAGVIAITAFGAAIFGGSLSVFMRSDFDVSVMVDRFRTSSTSVVSTGPYIRGADYYYCQRHFALKSTRRTSSEKVFACECFEQHTRLLSEPAQRDARWALRSQYTDLQKSRPGPVKAYTGIAGNGYYRAVYSAQSDKILAQCKAEIRLGEKRI